MRVRASGPLPSISTSRTRRARRTQHTDTAIRGSTESEESASEPEDSEPELELDMDVGEVVRRLHLSSVPSKLICRDQQYREIRDFVVGHLERRQGGSLYVCGSPGTGKSATVDVVVRRELARQHVIRINAMSLTRDPKLLYVHLLREMVDAETRASVTEDAMSASEAADALQAMFVTRSKAAKMTVVVIDEIDGLLTQAQTVLYRLFEWPKKTSSKIILVGIANAMDLTDRFLPRLRARECEPELVIFPAYSKDELYGILFHRISGRELSPPLQDDDDEQERLLRVFEPAALEICARKVAAMSGDIRKCMDVCRQCIDDLMLLPSANGKPDDDVGRVSMRDMARKLGTSMGSRYVAIMRGIPKHQQMLLCVASIVFRHDRKEATLTKFQEYYLALSKRISLPVVAATEFVDMFTALQTAGLISVHKDHRRRDIKSSKVTLNVQPDDIECALEDDELLSAVLEMGSKVGKFLL